MHSMKLKLQDFNHVHDRIESLTSDLNKTKATKTSLKENKHCVSL